MRCGNYRKIKGYTKRRESSRCVCRTRARTPDAGERAFRGQKLLFSYKVPLSRAILLKWPRKTTRQKLGYCRVQRCGQFRAAGKKLRIVARFEDEIAPPPSHPFTVLSYSIRLARCVSSHCSRSIGSTLLPLPRLSVTYSVSRSFPGLSLEGELAVLCAVREWACLSVGMENYGPYML